MDKVYSDAFDVKVDVNFQASKSRAAKKLNAKFDKLDQKLTQIRDDKDIQKIEKQCSTLDLQSLAGMVSTIRESQPSNTEEQKEIQSITQCQTMDQTNYVFKKEQFLSDYALKIKKNRINKFNASKANIKVQPSQIKLTSQTPVGWHSQNNSYIGLPKTTKTTSVPKSRVKKSVCSKIITDLNIDIKRAKASSSILPQIDLQPHSLPKYKKQKKRQFIDQRNSNLSTQAGSIYSTQPGSSMSRGGSQRKLQDIQTLPAQSYIVQTYKDEKQFHYAAKSILKFMNDFNTNPYNTGQEYHFKQSYL